MEELIVSLVSLIILVPIVYFLPLGLTKKGKIIIISVAFIFANVGLLAKNNIPILQTGLILLLLTILTVYLLEKRLKGIFVESSVDEKTVDFPVDLEEAMDEAAVSVESETALPYDEIIVNPQIEEVSSSSPQEEESFDMEELIEGLNKSTEENIDDERHDELQVDIIPLTNHEIELDSETEFLTTRSDDLADEEIVPAVGEEIFAENYMSEIEQLLNSTDEVDSESEKDLILDEKEIVEENVEGRVHFEDFELDDENILEENLLFEELDDLVDMDEIEVLEDLAIENHELDDTELEIDNQSMPEEYVLDVIELEEVSPIIYDEELLEEDIELSEAELLEVESEIAASTMNDGEDTIEELIVNPTEEITDLLEIELKDQEQLDSLTEMPETQEETAIDETEELVELLETSEEHNQLPIVADFYENEQEISQEATAINEAEELVEMLEISGEHDLLPTATDFYENEQEISQEEETVLNEEEPVEQVEANEEHAQIPLSTDISETEQIETPYIEKTILQQQIFHTMVSQLHVLRKQVTADEYEKLIKEHLHPGLSAQDYYTFASLLIEHYISQKDTEKLAELIASLRDKFTNYPILDMEIHYLYQQYCEKLR